jgi:HD-like signal output (HDOD) protein
LTDAARCPGRDEVCRRAAVLPCAPRLLPSLLAAMREAEVAADRIGELIKQDTGLAASTLRLANSAAYAREVPIADLTQAIVVLGRREIYRIAAAAMMSRWEESQQDLLPWPPGAFGRHSLGVAVTADVIATLLGEEDTTAYYSAGLVGDVGRLALAFICTGQYPRLAALARDSGNDWEKGEREVLGFTSREVGAELMRTWNFPEAFVTMVEFLPEPQKAPRGDRHFLAVMHAARFLSNSVYATPTPEEFLFKPQTDFLNAHGLVVDVLARALELAREKLRSRPV